MPADLNGSLLEDPGALARSFQDAGWPVGAWSQLCHSFRSPCEREPGVGHVLIKKSEWDKVADQGDLTLTFTTPDGTQVQFKKLHAVSAPTPLPQEYEPADPVLWVTLADRRARYTQVAAEESYNLRKADGTWDSDTLNAGTPYTWQEVVDDLWAKLKAVYTDLPAASTVAFPATPAGTPEWLDFEDADAWTALCRVVQAAGYLVFYDPRQGDLGVYLIDPAADPPAETAAAVSARWWDTGSWADIDLTTPESVAVPYRRIGRGDRHLVTVSAGGSPAGSAVVLDVDVQAAGDPVSNTTYLTAYAGRVTDFWLRDVAARADGRRVEYRGWVSWVPEAVGYGGWAAWGVCEQAEKEVTTLIAKGPLLRLTPGEFVPADVSLCDGYPLSVKVQVGAGVATTTAVVSGTTVVTGVTLTNHFRNLSWDADGCLLVGDEYCEAGTACVAGPDVAYWCIDGTCWTVYGGITPSSGTGPYATPELCAAACVDAWYCDGGTCVLVAAGDSPPGGSTGPYTSEALCDAACNGVDTECCEENIPATVFLALSVGGTVDLDYDGSTYWRNAVAHPLSGCDVYFRLSKADCVSVSYSRDGSTWVVATCLNGEAGCVVDCDPYSVTGLYNFSSAALGGGCSFGAITGSISE
jgi:hypothetical protein